MKGLSDETIVRAGGPVAAAQNCIMLGLFSYAVDYMQMQGAEAAGRRWYQQQQGRVRCCQVHRMPWGPPLGGESRTCSA